MDPQTTDLRLCQSVRVQHCVCHRLDAGLSRRISTAARSPRMQARCCYARSSSAPGCCGGWRGGSTIAASGGAAVMISGRCCASGCSPRRWATRISTTTRSCAGTWRSRRRCHGTCRWRRHRRCAGSSSAVMRGSCGRRTRCSSSSSSPRSTRPRSG